MIRLHARSRGRIASTNRQDLWKRRLREVGIVSRRRGVLPAPLWIIRRRRDKPGFRVRRIAWARFLDYARRDRRTIAILKCEADARAYRDRLRDLDL